MICPNCGTRLPEGSTCCHFCGFTVADPAPTTRETAIVVLMLAAVMVTVSLLLMVATSEADLDLRIRVVFCFAIGAVVSWVYWKVSRWANPRLERFG